MAGGKNKMGKAFRLVIENISHINHILLSSRGNFGMNEDLHFCSLLIRSFLVSAIYCQKSSSLSLCPGREPKIIRCWTVSEIWAAWPGIIKKNEATITSGRAKAPNLPKDVSLHRRTLCLTLCISILTKISRGKFFNYAVMQ